MAATENDDRAFITQFDHICRNTLSSSLRFYLSDLSNIRTGDFQTWLELVKKWSVFDLLNRNNVIAWKSGWMTIANTLKDRRPYAMRDTFPWFCAWVCNNVSPDWVGQMALILFDEDMVTFSRLNSFMSEEFERFIQKHNIMLNLLGCKRRKRPSIEKIKVYLSMRILPALCTVSDVNIIVRRETLMLLYFVSEVTRLVQQWTLQDVCKRAIIIRLLRLVDNEFNSTIFAQFTGTRTATTITLILNECHRLSPMTLVW
jgi:hypothetical protein